MDVGLQRRAPLAVLLIGVCVSGACGPADPDPPYVSEVLAYTGAGRYQVRAEPLATLHDFHGMSGEAGQFHGGGFIRLTSSSDIDTEEEFRSAFRVRGAHRLALDYQIVKGVVRANDYDTFAMLSLYRALERTRAFYRGVGVGDEAMPTLAVYFRPRIEVLVFPLLASNNAAYSSPLDGFLFFNDFFAGSAVPVALNLGVIAHEYGHAVWQHVLWKGRLPAWALDSWPDRAVNELRALDEGLADLFGATITDDPRFVGRSAAKLTAERDVSVTRMVVASDLAAAAGGSLLYDPYRLGSVVASALWTVGQRTGRQALAGYVVDAERRASGRIDRDFRIGWFLDQIAVAAAATDAEHRAAVCEILVTQLSALGPYPCCVEAAEGCR